MTLFKKFQLGLKKTSNYLTKNILDTLSIKKINEETIEELESILLSGDIGIEVTNQLISKLKSIRISNKENSKEILQFLETEIEVILKKREGLLLQPKNSIPTVLLFIGVNGSGKTTTIGKLISKMPQNKKILIGACDTFRAAAVEQLKEWSIKNNTDFYQGSLDQDPASVAYTASVKTKKEMYDYLIIDTAGRLSNNTNLLNQLIKVKNAISKTININNIHTILVLDGTNGSNMIKQVEIFNKSMNVNGIIITKIDGTAKGGALISIAKNYEIPIYFVGLGETIDDLQEFRAKDFASSMFSIEE